MSRLVWDDTGKKRYEMGVDHGVLYPMKKGAYQKGVAWNGLISVTESPEGGEANDMYADNIKYASLRSAETFGGTIEAYTYPDEFAACDGSIVPAAGVSIGQQSREACGFCYRTKVGDDTSQNKGYILHIAYGCTVSPSEKAYETINDSPEAITFSWEFDTTPVEVGTPEGYIGGEFAPTALLTIDSTKVADPTKLQKLEDVLYGTDMEGEPRLPLPKEVIEFFTKEGD